MRKKKIVFFILLIVSLILLIVLSIISLREMQIKMLSSNCMQKEMNFDSSSPFSINKIVYFSSAHSDSNINSNSSFTLSNLYQYTDMAIFINNNANGEFTAKNTFKSVKISDIKYNLKPSIGSPNLYYKNINNFATNSFEENSKIEDNLNFEISSEDEIDYSTPTLFNNSANPITLCYVNSNIKSNYTLTDNISNISYNGSLLKTCNVTLNSIACKLSFLITIVNNLDEVYTCPMILNIPLSTENSTIYDGNLTITDSTNYNFVKNVN